MKVLLSELNYRKKYFHYSLIWDTPVDTCHRNDESQLFTCGVNSWKLMLQYEGEKEEDN